MATINSGITVRLLSRTVFNVPGGINTSITFPIASHLDTSVFTEADLLVRFHGGTGGTSLPSAGQTATVNVLPDGYDFADPASVFTGSSIASAQITNSTSIPYYTVLAIPTPFGRLLSFNLVVVQTSTGGAITVALSLDINLKGGDPTGMPLMPNGFRGYRIM
jgi:hypothetical protein